MGKQVCLVDAGTGNLRSVQHALLTIGAEVLCTDTAADLRSAGCVVLPGVGAFGRFMAGLNEKGLADAVKGAVIRGIPVLGICVGMQALFEIGFEMGEFPGLALIPGQVVRFPNLPALKIPHTGWNQFHFTRANPLLAGLEEGAYAYFNHSYYCQPVDAADALAQTDYGIRYASIVQRENLFGVQFHPEKSQRVGLTLLANFLKIS